MQRGVLKKFKMAVVITTKNRLDDLIRTSERVKRQTCRLHELIIVDQSVTDIARAHIEDFDFYSKASTHFKFALAPAAHALHDISSVDRKELKHSFEAKCSGFYKVY